MKYAGIMLIWLMLAGVSGCASLSPVAGRTSPAAGDTPADLPQGEGWWYARFHISRPQGDPVHWHLDALIAGEIIAPVMQAHPGDIRIWRIHRRAGDDSFGHVFSFIFYADTHAASRINDAFSKHPTVALLEQGGQLRKLTLDDPRHIRRPGIGDTSDSNWPELVQLTWPALAMGASRMWLDMVGELAGTAPQSDDLEEHYRTVHAEVTRLWQEQGQHAVLHHLSAIYGYAPVLMRY